jgi:hypothetical protein
MILIEQNLEWQLVEYIANKLNTSTTLGFSNVIGPAEEIEFCDNHVTHIIPTAYVNHTVSVIWPCFIYLYMYLDL